MSEISRRSFLRGGAAVLGSTLLLPKVAKAVAGPPKVFIMVEQLGGPDCFLMSIPLETSRRNALNARRSAFTSYYSSPQLLDLGYGQNVALHPGLYPLNPYLNDLRVTLGCINVKNEPPSGSHEEQQARMAFGTMPTAGVTNGWTARMFESGSRLVCFNGAKGQDYACTTEACRLSPPLVTDNFESFRLEGTEFHWQYQGGANNTQLVSNTIREIAGLELDSSANQKERGFRSAQQAMLNATADIQATITNPTYRTPAYDRYINDTPGDGNTRGLAQRFRNLAQLINRLKIENAGGTLICVVPHGGYDSHSNFTAVTSSLMAGLGSVLRVFLDDMVAIGMHNNTVTMTIGEFGRQIGTNGFGTDHGTALTTLVLGGRINGGRNALYGPMLTANEIQTGYAWPLTTDSVDTRSIIADVIQYHLGLNPYLTAFPGAIGQEFARPQMSLLKA